MKLFAKVFAAVTLILCVSLALSGYLLISGSFENAVNRECTKALERYQLTKFALQSVMESKGESAIGSEWSMEEWIPKLEGISSTVSVASVFSEDKQPLYSEYPKSYPLTLLDRVGEQELLYEIRQVEDQYILTVVGCFRHKGKLMYLMTGVDVSLLLEQQREMRERYAVIYCIVCACGMAAVLFLSLWIVFPIKKMTHSAAQIAAGDYSARVSLATKDELGELGQSFNTMASAVEESIERLTQNAVQKEDFVASFAHELKTPLTSVIGYADMISQREMTPEQVREAASYILEEGMRLEQLSLKLMDLIVLNRQEFILEELPAKEVLSDIVQTLRPILDKRQVCLKQEIQEVWICVEYDLFKTLLLNVMDNSIKADATVILLKGERLAEGYRITITDNGRGIPKDEIRRITEAFYMVDKSRSRSQHGAGIGLALVERIAEIHGTKIQIESEEGKGTAVSIVLAVSEENNG